MPQLRFYAGSTAPATAQSKVDRQNSIIRGVVAMQANVEALGHGMMTDDKTIQMMLALAQDGKPRRQRFGHPGISENATGKQIANAKNFRIENGNLVHDSIFLESARSSPAFSQDPVEYILTMAETDPTEFGESVVINADVVWTLPNGREVQPFMPERSGYNDKQTKQTYVDVEGVTRESNSGRPIDALTPLPVVRPTKFYYVDYVNEGAATHNGMFEAKFFTSGVNAYAEELFTLADLWRQEYNIPLEKLPMKLDQLLTAYIETRSKDEIMSKRTTFAALSAEKYESDEELETADVLDDGQDSEGEKDELSEAEAMATQLGQVQDVSPIANELGDRIDHLEGLIEKLAAKFDRMAALQSKQVEALVTLQRNQARLSGEPVVSQKVNKQPVPAMEQIPAFAHPAPNGVNTMQFSKPTHVSQRMSNQPGDYQDDSDLDAAQAAIIRRKRLAAQHNPNGMFSEGLAVNPYIGGQS